MSRALSALEPRRDFVYVCEQSVMARVFGLDEEHCTAALRQALQNNLRLYDECIVLPQAHRSAESGGFKNVALRLSGTEPDLSGEVFSPNWFSGVSAALVDPKLAEALLKDPAKRAAALKRLAAIVPSEMEGADVTVGPDLDGDPQDRDLKPWVPGFDGPGCCVGLYSAAQSKSPEVGIQGLSRTHHVYFLVCKAGGGIAAQTFHARICASLSKGQSLDDCLASGNEPGAQALRRVSMAAQRNRGRILVMAAEALGFHTIDTIGDNASPEGSQYRMAITQLNVHTNVLRKVEEAGRAGTYHYAAGCVDVQTSQGLVASSNVAEGFVVFTDSNGGYKINLKNGAHNTVPFATVRLQSNRDIVTKAADLHKTHGERAHPDAEWIRERFAWKAKDFGVDLEPPPLWGSHNSEEFVTAWGREIGVSSCRVVRLQPEVVAIAATEPARLRAAAKHVNGGATPRGGRAVPIR